MIFDKTRLIDKPKKVRKAMRKEALVFRNVTFLCLMLGVSGLVAATIVNWVAMTKWTVVLVLTLVIAMLCVGVWTETQYRSFKAKRKKSDKEAAAVSSLGKLFDELQRIADRFSIR